MCEQQCLTGSSLVSGHVPSHPSPEASPNPNPNLTVTQTLDLTKGTWSATEQGSSHLVWWEQGRGFRFGL